MTDVGKLIKKDDDDEYDSKQLSRLRGLDGGTITVRRNGTIHKPKQGKSIEDIVALKKFKRKR